MKYDVTHICGHTRTYDLYGPHSTRQRKIEWLKEQDCLDCREEKLMKKITEFEEECGLPRLTGAEKKVIWARKIRYESFKELERLMDETERELKNTQAELEDESLAGEIESIKQWIDKTKAEQQQLDVIMDLFLSMTEAVWWYENEVECKHPDGNRKWLYSMAIKEQEKKESFEEMKAACGEYRIVPDDPNSEDDIAVMIERDVVWAKTNKNDTIIEVMHDCHFKYSYSNNRWEHPINEMTGSAEDRAAELMNHLTLKGFTVVCYSEEAYQKAIDATYEEEHLRWILAPKSTSTLCIRIGYNDGTYEAWKGIGAKYDKPDMTINPKKKDEIEELARELGYKFTEAALERMAQEAEKQSHTTQVKEKLKEDKKVQAVIQDEAALLSELMDED